MDAGLVEKMDEKTGKNVRKKEKAFRIWKILLGIFLIMVIVLLVDVRIWAKENFGKVPFAQIVYHMNVPLEGTDSHVLEGYLNTIIPDILVVAFLLFMVFLPDIVKICSRCISKKENDKKTESNQTKERIKSIPCKILSAFGKVRYFLIRNLHLFAAFGLIVVLIIDVRWFGVLPWVKNQLQSSKLYEQYYVDPTEVKITAPEHKKNLILIFSESMEATFGKTEDGGASSYDLIPNLTRLAKENTHFSRENDLKGSIQVNGTEWTMAGMVAYTAGIPLVTPFNQNSVNRKESFLPGVTSLGEILEENGYLNEMIVGSNKGFAGKDLYFGQHGNYAIYDLYSAIKDAYIDEPNDFWGFEDRLLFQIAKDRIKEAAKEDQPFHFLINSVDTHNPTGFRCASCKNTFSETIGGETGQYMDVISCQDRQISEFVEWCKGQDFYEETVIVIVGDHTCMSSFVEEEMKPKDYERTVYHVIMNSSLEPTNTTNRLFTTMDMFPTILASLGFEIEGDRLGIGTNLYSGVQTVTEQMGLEKYMEEIGKNSRKYNKEILKTK